MARCAIVVAVLLLAACGDDGSPSGADGGGRAGIDAGGGGIDGGGSTVDAGPAFDAGPTPPRRDAGADRMCPPAMDTRCGSACTGSETMCLCTCGGGGFDFTACNCVAGAWDCPECR